MTKMSIDDKIVIAKNLNTKYYKQGWYDLITYHYYNMLIDKNVEMGSIQLRYDVMKEKVKMYNERQQNNR